MSSSGSQFSPCTAPPCLHGTASIPARAAVKAPKHHCPSGCSGDSHSLQLIGSYLQQSPADGCGTRLASLSLSLKPQSCKEAKAEKSLLKDSDVHYSQTWHQHRAESLKFNSGELCCCHSQVIDAQVPGMRHELPAIPSGTSSTYL